MIEQDTVKLLRECDAGVRMGVSSIGEARDYAHSGRLRRLLDDCRAEHEKLGREIEGLLRQYHDEDKELSPMARGMSWVRTNVRLAFGESDSAVAGLMTDGCNMGVKSLARYLNQYQAADEESKAIARRLIGLEERLAKDVRSFL
ncbi:MAG TPA: hypothetical protein IAB55_05260 [Candidatus Merdivicinus faecavium]|nr:hypothetical protein [Candidatus Merdivicinus faecavium]